MSLSEIVFYTSWIIGYFLIVKLYWACVSLDDRWNNSPFVLRVKCQVWAIGCSPIFGFFVWKMFQKSGYFPGW